MPTSSTWPSSSLTWNNGPSNNTSSAWEFTSATQLGTYSLPCQETVNSVVTVNLDVNYFKNDSDKVVILGMSFGTTNAGSSFKAYESGTSGPKIKVTY
jgi:hypothetical protein